MASEKAILNQTLIDITAVAETMAYRQNTGQAWQGERLRLGVGQFVKIEPGMVVLRGARPVSFGIEGAGDIVGVSHGKAFQIEQKTETGRQRDAQKRFETAWVKAGGVYILARSAEEACDKLLTAVT